MEEVYKNIDDYFLRSHRTKLYTDPASSVEIYRGSGIFYKGIRVDSRPTAFAYNFLSHVQLTEDRTIGNSWLVEYYLAEAVRRAPKADFLQEILSKPDIAEHRFNWDGISSKEVAALLRKASSAGNLPPAFQHSRQHGNAGRGGI